MTRSVAATLFVCATLAFGTAPSMAAPRTVTLDEALRKAGEQGSRVRAADAGIEAARAQRKEGRARFLPILRTEGNLQVWDDAVDVAFAEGSDAAAQLPPPETPYEAAVAGLVGGLSEPTRIRDQVTADLTVSVIQPLDELFILRPTYDTLDLGVERARLGRKQASRESELRAASAFFQFHQARALADSARQSVEELRAQLERLEALVAGGVAKGSDRLRLRVAVAAARQDELSARNRIELARSALATAMNLPPEAPIEPDALDDPRCAPALTDLETLYQRARKQREELADLRSATEQAELAIPAAKAELAPDVAAVASYTHLEGQSLAAQDAAFVGLTLSWNVWDWGASYQGVQAARARVRQATAGQEAAEDGVLLQVKRARLDLQTAVDSLELAGLAAKEAAESFRVVSSRYEAGDANTTDVLTAETALAEARNRRVVARYQCLVAHAELRSAVGDPLTAENLVFHGGDDVRP
ncbi:MAG: TolC family protein [Myxococcota bacterium]